MVREGGGHRNRQSSKFGQICGFSAVSRPRDDNIKLKVGKEENYTASLLQAEFGFEP